jgi:hypothetical protein
MGQFPYDCVICGGGRERCAHDAVEHGPCDDTSGQFCWEDCLVIKVLPPKLSPQQS